MKFATNTVWRRTERCVSDYHCVEIAQLDDAVAIRNSQRPEISLVLSIKAWRDLVDRVKSGELDVRRTANS